MVSSVWFANIYAVDGGEGVALRGVESARPGTVCVGLLLSLIHPALPPAPPERAPFPPPRLLVHPALGALCPAFAAENSVSVRLRQSQASGSGSGSGSESGSW